MGERVSRAVCLFIVWPALLLTFRALSPAPKLTSLVTYRRQWGVIIPMRQRMLYCRLEIAIASVESDER